MMKEKKLSLLKEIGKEKIIKDERITGENNKIVSTVYSALVSILVFGSVIFDMINVKINSSIIFMVIGIVSYIGLILLCKKNAIEGNKGADSFFIWSIFTLPASMWNSVDDYIYECENEKISIIVGLVGIVVLTEVLYQIANTVYKKNNK